MSSIRSDPGPDQVLLLGSRPRPYPFRGGGSMRIAMSGGGGGD